jgi:hypothetical protein
VGESTALSTLLTPPLSTDKDGMPCLAICAVLFGLTATTVFGAELSGTAQVSGKPIQNAVIWLDAHPRIYDSSLDVGLTYSLRIR